MSDAQIDMFEVQLGAGMLMQFKDNSGHIVRVLADAGIKASDYNDDHVHKKLTQAFESFTNPGCERRIDLVIGTHYDADHLDGLVPIINDTSIEIGEAWMPPVANDTMVHAAEDSVQDRHLLGYQFMQKDGREKLLLYLKKKYAVCEELAEIETAAHEFVKTERLENKFDLPLTLKLTQEESDIDIYLNYFKSQASSEGHADEDILDIPDLDDMHVMLRSRNWLMRNNYVHWQQNRKIRLNSLLNYWKENSVAAQTHVTNLAYVRKSTAKDAINAISLAKVVMALKTRNIPLSFKMIADGNPRRFVWKSQERKFTPGQQLTSDGPELMLLGPSEGLVKKLWDKLPIGDYVAVLAISDIPIRSITPSNQLSYVVRLQIKEQGILVCGDAGFVDFKHHHGEYRSDLLQQLMPLHVIQVAHHGGCNAHFYRVLLKAEYARQKDKSYLLLSHATYDKYRPSKEFGMFIKQVRQEGDDMQLLFTSRPNKSMVRDYTEIVHPVVGNKADVGDICLVLDQSRWQVKSHAISVV